MSSYKHTISKYYNINSLIFIIKNFLNYSIYFLVSNLVPVTQLYVSVDASTKESLKKIDRPLFKDFWERFVDSLKALSAKRQRTVYRLTLVKAWNTDELDSYAELVSLGKPDFIEIKVMRSYLPWYVPVSFNLQLYTVHLNKTLNLTWIY